MLCRLLLLALLACSVQAHADVFGVKQCGSLSGMSIAPDRIGLPTRGALIQNAEMVSASAPRNRNGDYCKIVGIIKARLDTTPDIRFEVNLPAHWNGRALQMGGGGYSGVVVSGTEPTAFAPSASPLFLGYATFGSDSGHVGNAGLASFALNDEAVKNFGYGHLKKTHDVAMALIDMGYGRKPEKTYFAGGSTGGREAFTVIERFPQDYDGVIANAPAINFSGVRLIGILAGQAAFKTPDGFVDTAAQKRVFDTVMRYCDALDGARDGIVSDVEACRAKEPQIISDLRCDHDNASAASPAPPPATHGTARPASAPTENGAVVAMPCLSEAQIHTLTTLRDGLTLPYALAYGVTRYDGYNVFQGSDFRSGLGLGDSAHIFAPPSFANGYLFAQADGYMKYFVTRNVQFDTLGFDIDHPGAFQPRLVALSAVVGAMNPDMSAFIAHGGKLIVMHGLADEVISPNQTIAFYKELVAHYGRDTVNGFMRLYMVPGFQHGNGVFIPAWDELGALDRWVSKNEAPETLIGADISQSTNGRTRPLCRYPTFPRYIGKGNINQASSFRCATDLTG